MIADLPSEWEFQHTAARRRLPAAVAAAMTSRGVSTHSRPKAAARLSGAAITHGRLFQHTAARRRLPEIDRPAARIIIVSTHSRPKAAASTFVGRIGVGRVKFQHTAARRRLLRIMIIRVPNIVVSTHSRPKAAAFWAFCRVM